MVELSELQNKLKRNPSAYVFEFQQQLRSFRSQLAIFSLSPPSNYKDFGKLAAFLAQVSDLYPNDSKSFAMELLRFLEASYETIHPKLRHVLFKSLTLLRTRGVLPPLDLLISCFSLFRCQDKELRSLLFSYIVSDIRQINTVSNNNALNKAIQNQVYIMMDEANSIASKMSLRVMIELYKRRVWTDTRTVNVIAAACLSSQPKNVVAAIHFFLGIDDKIDEWEDDEEAKLATERLEASTGRTKENVEKSSSKTAKNFSKQTKARERRKLRDMRALKKARRCYDGGQQNAETKRMSSVRFPAIELLNDPHGFSEKLFKNLKTSGDRFEQKLLMMNLISRIVGFHKVLLLPFYSFLQRYMQPHQRNVTNVLAFSIQASHDLVPPEDIEPLVKHIANTFVTDRSGPEAMAVGLNTIRELIGKVPLLTCCPGIDDLVQDLVLYKRYRRDRGVVIAARGLLNCLREVNPDALQRKERGKFRNTSSLKAYGESDAPEGVDGAELLQMLEEDAKRIRAMQEGVEINEDSGSDCEENGSDCEENDSDCEDNDSDCEENDSDCEESEGAKDSGDDSSKAALDGSRTKKSDISSSSKEDGDDTQDAADLESETLLEKSKKRIISQTSRIDAKRFLTDEDFRRIRKLKAKLEKEKRDPRARRRKEKLKKTLKTRNALLEKLQKEGYDIEGVDEVESDNELQMLDSDFEESDESDSDDDQRADGVVEPSSLVGVIKRRRQELSDRLARVYEGRQDMLQEKKRTGGTSNMEKQKNKNYLMVKKSATVTRKQHTSLRQQQQALKRHIKRMERTKKIVQKARRR